MTNSQLRKMDPKTAQAINLAKSACFLVTLDSIFLVLKSGHARPMEHGLVFLFTAPKRPVVFCPRYFLVKKVISTKEAFVVEYIIFSPATDQYSALQVVILARFALLHAIPVILLLDPKQERVKPTTLGQDLSLTVSKSRALFLSRLQMDTFHAPPEICSIQSVHLVAKLDSIFRQGSQTFIQV